MSILDYSTLENEWKNYRQKVLQGKVCTPYSCRRARRLVELRKEYIENQSRIW